MILLLAVLLFLGSAIACAIQRAYGSALLSAGLAAWAAVGLHIHTT